jgi:hypothetical protein
MKKLLILLSITLFGISASFAQVDIVTVHWNWYPDECNCGDHIAGDYFKVVVSIFDDANGEYVVQDRTVTAPIGTPPPYSYEKDVDVPEVDTYCNKEHDETPSFTVYSWVWMIDAPDTECCSASNDTGGWICHDFYNSKVDNYVDTLE